MYIHQSSHLWNYHEMEDQVVEMCDSVGYVEYKGVSSLIGRRLDVMKTTFVNDTLCEGLDMMLYSFWSRLLKNIYNILIYIYIYVFLYPTYSWLYIVLNCYTGRFNTRTLFSNKQGRTQG